MNKKSMTLLSTAALIATVAAGNQVYADDTATPTTPVANEASATETKITESDVTKAKEEVTQAQNEVADAKEQVNEATETLNTANQEVSDTQEAIQSGEQASQIVAEQDKVITEKTAEKEALDKQLSDAQKAQTKAQSQVGDAVNQQAQAQTQVNTAKSQVDTKQQAFDKAQAKESQAVEKVTETEKALQQETQKVSQTIADIEKVDTKISETQKALDTQKVEKKVLYQQDGYKQKADKNAKRMNMEKVDFQGSRTVEIEVSPEQYAKYLETGYTDYNLDNKEIAQAFVKMLNELRALNGLSSDFEVDEEFQAYSEARAKEMLANNKLSHDTELGRLPNSQESIGARYGTKNQPKFMSAEQFAYENLLGWYSDYNNVDGRDYGHRRSLLTPTGGKIGFATAYRLNGRDLTGYNAYNTLDNKAKFHLEHDDLGDMYVCDTPEDEAIFEESVAMFNTWDESDKLNPTFLGRHMVFLPEYTFVYVTKVAKDGGNRDTLRNELNTLNNQKVALVAKKTAHEREVKRLEETLQALTQKVDAFTHAKDVAKHELTQAKEALTVATNTLNEATAFVRQQTKALDDAKRKVSALSSQVETVANTIAKANVTRENALQNKQDLDALKVRLAKAKEAQAQAVQNKADADAKLIVAEDTLLKVTDVYTQLANRYELQQRIDAALKDKVDNKVDNGVIDTPKVDVPKVDTPKVDVPKVEEPKVDTPKVDTPKVDTPKVDTPKVDTPKVDTPKVDTPKVEEPKVDTPKVDETKVDETKVDESKVDTPKVETKVEEPKVNYTVKEIKPVTSTTTTPNTTVKTVSIDSRYFADTKTTRKQLPKTGATSALWATIAGMFSLVGAGALRRKRK